PASAAGAAPARLILVAGRRSSRLLVARPRGRCFCVVALRPVSVRFGWHAGRPGSAAAETSQGVRGPAPKPAGAVVPHLAVTSYAAKARYKRLRPPLACRATQIDDTESGAVNNDEDLISAEQPARSVAAPLSRHSRPSPLASAEAMAAASLSEAWSTLTWAERLAAFKQQSRREAEELFL